MDSKTLHNFLKTANKATYANTSAPKAGSLRPGSEDYHFEQGDLVFHDTYFGARDFIGEEVVYEKGVPVWGMNYFGRVLKGDVPTDEAYRILRPALIQEYDDILPVRGPREYREGGHMYRNTVEGDLRAFSGKEEILIEDEVVYRGVYHGGLIS